jgi:hypothetical protein
MLVDGVMFRFNDSNNYQAIVGLPDELRIVRIVWSLI